MSEQKSMWGISWDGLESWLEPCQNQNICHHDDHYKTFAEGKREICNYYRERLIGARASLKQWRRFKKADCGEGVK
jgi:hypothetical protein